VKPILYTCIAVLFYALGNVITEQRLKSYTQFGIMMYCYVPMLALTFAALVFMKFRNQPIAFPEGNGLYAAGVIALVFFIADTFFFSAYTNNADAFTVSSIGLMFPPAASLMKFLLTREIPNRYHIAAYLFAVAAVALAEKASEFRQH